MIAKRLTIPLALVLGTGIGAQEVKKQEEGKRQELDQVVAGQSLRIELLEQDLLAVKEYLAAQADSAKALSEAMDAADKAGFTWGVNPDAHTFVLDGIRSHAAATQKNVPAPDPEPEPEPTGRRRPRRR